MARAVVMRRERELAAVERRERDVFNRRAPGLLRRGLWRRRLPGLLEPSAARHHPGSASFEGIRVEAVVVGEERSASQQAGPRRAPRPRGLSTVARGNARRRVAPGRTIRVVAAPSRHAHNLRRTRPRPVDQRRAATRLRGLDRLVVQEARVDLRARTRTRARDDDFLGGASRRPRGRRGGYSVEAATPRAPRRYSVEAATPRAPRWLFRGGSDAAGAALASS